MKLLNKISFIFLFWVFLLNAQEESLKDKTSFIFGGEYKIVRFYKIHNPMAGGHLGLYWGPVFLGASGYTSISKTKFNLTEDKPKSKLDNISYGGFNFRYIPHSPSFLNLTATCLMGAGFMNFDEEDYYVPEKFKENHFFTIEPGFNVMLNVSESFRLGYGISWQGFISPELEIYEHGDISGFSTNITAQFGRI